MALVYAYPAFAILQYDGTNSAEIIDEVEAAMVAGMGNGTASITSETGGVLSIQTDQDRGLGGIEHGYATINTNDWIIPGFEPPVYPDSVISTQWVKV